MFPTPQFTEEDLYRERLRQMMMQDNPTPDQFQPRVPAPVAQYQPQISQPEIQPQVAPPENFHRQQVVLPEQQPQRAVVPPNFSPVDVPKRPYLPGERPTAEQQPEVSKPDSKKMKFLRALGTVGMGIAMGPGGAMAGHAMFGKGPSDARMRARNLQLGKEQEEIEKQRFGEGEKSAELGIKRGTGESLDTARTLTADIKQQQADTAASKAKSYEDNIASLTAHRTALEKKVSDLERIIEMPPGPDKEAAIKVYQQLKQTQKETTAEKVQQTIDVNADPKNLPKLAATAKAKGVTPQAAAARASAVAQATQDVKTSDEAVSKQAKLARAKSLAILTTNEKDTIRGAQVALQAFPDIRSELKTASEDMFGNRWNEFTTGTLGSNPEFAPLRENLGLLQTLVAKLHVGSRGSVHILNKFETLFNAKQMDKATLASSLDELEKWLVRYSKAPPGTDPSTVTDKDTTPAGHRRIE